MIDIPFPLLVILIILCLLMVIAFTATFFVRYNEYKNDYEMAEMTNETKNTLITDKKNK